MRVLYVEDDAADADLARRALARRAPQIVLEVAATLEQARARLQTTPLPEVLLMDLALSDGSGLDLLAQVRAQALPLAVVMLTGSGSQEAVVAALKAGADDYLVKRGDYLERLPHTLARAHTHFRAQDARKRQGLRVLYVEHNAADADLLRRHLVRHAPHIRLDCVVDAASALARLGDDEPPWDVLLADYRLPDMDGLELARHLREDLGLALPIVLVTAHGSEEVAARALHLGVDDYLIKHPGYLYEVPAVLEKVHRQAQLAGVHQRLARFVESSPVVLYSLRSEAGQFMADWVSENAARILGLDPDGLAGSDFPPVHPDDRSLLAQAREQALREGHAVVQYRLDLPHWPQRWLRDEINRTEHGGRGLRLVGALGEITERVLAEQVEAVRRQALDDLLAGRPIDDILTAVALRLEALAPQMRISILLRDPRENVLRLAAAPSLPEDYNRKVDGLPVAPGHGSCGSAAATGEPVIASDVTTHPDWTPYRQAIAGYDFRACSSWPFKDAQGQVLGSFAVYLAEARAPSPAEVALIEPFCQIAALAVERYRVEERLRQAAAVFESTRDGILITDVRAEILAVNPAFCRISGYSAEELVGRNAAMLKSHYHEPAFYRALAQTLRETGQWQGELYNRRKDGELYPQWLNISGIYDASGQLRGYVGVATDLSEIKSAHARLQVLAHHDALTGLPNRLLLNTRLEAAIARAHRYGMRLAVLFIDLDRFKDINDCFGHPVGDELLVAVAQRLHGRLREGDTLARLGGDEFILLLEELGSAEQAAAVARDLIERFREPFTLGGGQQAFVGLSIGVSLYPEDAANATELIQHADTAMYAAKAQGRNTYRFHTEALTEQARARLTLETRLRLACEREEFVVHYQPLIDLSGDRPFGVEALVRWYPAEGPPVSPSRFIPLAEEIGLIHAIGRFVLQRACHDAKALRDAGLPLERLAVNLSMRQFEDAGMAEMIAAVLAESGLPPHCLQVELTESLFMHDPEKLLVELAELRRLGVRLAIDDFGTGYSSLAYLRRYAPDTLKIDASFVRDIDVDAADRAIAATIIAMARSLGVKVLAEGVETAAQLAELRTLDCDAAQGYLFGRPMPAEALQAWWQSWATTPQE